MSNKIKYARDGYLFMRVSTPRVFMEYEIPKHGKLTGIDLARYESLQALAEVHRTPINSGTYRVG